MVPLQIAKDRTGRGGRAGLWNATAEESIVLCGIAKGDASGKRTWRARRPRRPGSRWSRGGRPAAQPCYSQRVAGVRAPCVMDLAYHHNKGLPSGNLNVERLIRIRGRACVSNPVGAEIVRIEAPQISRSEDGMVCVAHRIRIDRHALRRTGGVGECVRIVMVLSRITKDPARRSRRTG